MKLLELKLTTPSRKLLFAASLLLILGVHFVVAKWAFANMAAAAADDPHIADLTVRMSNDDPQTHFAAAVLYDKTFLPEDQARSLKEYEAAVALSPENYLLWIEFGKALGRSGDNERSERALRRAQDLAPNYSMVHWTLGNALVRAGKHDEGFREVRSAVRRDRQFASPAATLAYGYFDGDLDQIRPIFEDSPSLDAALALLLANERRYDEAVEIWRRVGNTEGDTALAETGKALAALFIEAKKFLAAQLVITSVVTNPAFAPGVITNGGFEEPLLLQNAPAFDWQISQGTQPQILQSSGQHRGGGQSLVLVYSSANGETLRDIRQLVAVEPGAAYALKGFYRSDIRSPGALSWQVLNAADGAVLAKTDALGPTNDWKEFAAAFTVPRAVDGVTLRLTRENCGSAICPIAGNAWFDDLRLERK